MVCEILVDSEADGSCDGEDDDQRSEGFFLGGGGEVAAVGDSHCAEGIDDFYEDLGDDSSEKVPFWDDEQSEDYPEDYADDIIFEEDILLIDGDEEVIIDLFDEA